LPDLYDTDGSGDGIGSWGLMANSWDFDFTQYCPPHFSPWSKIDLGWYSPMVITQPGEYVINQAETNAEVYRIDSGFPAGEYLLIENR
jgi:M6 family metalloprotease-like protein